LSEKHLQALLEIACGLSYREAVELHGIALGTMKSRV
jgi:DNA-directed RNA polymerase specialized sigma24 family protein